MTPAAHTSRRREAMVRNVVAAGHATNPLVQAAMTQLPREVFVRDVPVAEAYLHQRDTTPGATAGWVYSGRSIEPVVIAMMLDQLDVRPGDHVLHIGTGTGYTAALLAEIAGPGRVVTIDRTNSITLGARSALQTEGYDEVEVITGDGNNGAPGHGAFDRIIVTASSYDLPAAWTEQLAPYGRLVVPLRIRGVSRSVVFQARDGVLDAHDSQPCTLPRMLGAEHDRPRTSPIGPHGRLVLAWDHDLEAFVRGHGLGEPESYSNTCEENSDVVVDHDEPLDRLWLHLAATERGVFGLSATRFASMVPELAFPNATPALIADQTLAYLTRREIPAAIDGTQRYELGVAGVGPFAARLATVYAERIREWAARRQAHPTITVYPAGVAALPPGQRVQRTGHSFLLQPTTAS